MSLLPDILVSIVGAGPGDPELLTVKALRLIQNADVVLYDNLITSEILALIPERATKIYVGKKFGDKQDVVSRQDAIHQLMLQHAQEGKKVVRLKNGDPYIFGRAVEEVRFLMEHHIPFEVIPGVTAGIAAANLLNIPLTERNKTSAVLFCTGHTATYDFNHLEAVAKMVKEGTPLVLYMGYTNLLEVVSKLREAGVPDTTHVSAVSNISRTNQQAIHGNFTTIVQSLEEKKPDMPVLFIIGEYAFPLEMES